MSGIFLKKFYKALAEIYIYVYYRLRYLNKEMIVESKTPLHPHERAGGNYSHENTLPKGVRAFDFRLHIRSLDTGNPSKSFKT